MWRVVIKTASGEYRTRFGWDMPFTTFSEAQECARRLERIQGCATSVIYLGWEEEGC